MMKRMKLQTPPEEMGQSHASLPLVGLDGKERRPSRRFQQTVTVSRYLPDNEKLVSNSGLLCTRYAATDLVV